MAYFTAPTRPLLESDAWRRWCPDPLVVVDGGARGRLFEPFDRLRSPLRVVAFEPDPEASVGEGVQRIPLALWSERTTVDLHLAARPGTSSVLPPDLEFLADFPDRVGAPARRTVRVLRMAATSIDAEVADGNMPAPDFIKLDVHSAEHPVLCGAVETLVQTSGVLVETWHAPVHHGQVGHGGVEAFLNDHGFHLFDLRPASTWRYQRSGKFSRADRGRTVGSEALFLPTHPNDDRVLRVAGIADLFGFNVYAQLLLSRSTAAGASDLLVELEAIERARRLMPRRTLARLLRAVAARLDP